MSARIRLILVGLLVAIAAGGYWFWRSSQGKETTDDAQVDGHVYSVGTRVTGTVVEMHAENNAYVKAGDIIVKIDPRDYEVAVLRAKADLAEAEAKYGASRSEVALTTTDAESRLAHATATISEVEAQIATAARQNASAEARKRAAEARVAESKANLDRINKDLERWRMLVSKDEISQQQFDGALASARAAQAQLDATEAAAQEAENAVKVSEAQLVRERASMPRVQADRASASTVPEQIATVRARANSAQAAVEQARAKLADAELKLEYTVIRAPMSGIINRRSLELGQTVQAGQALLAIVPLDNLWITANYKETQLNGMHPGQRAKIEVDAYPGYEFTGKIQSLAAATGARFSLLPPENASGNFVKVIQRVPVKIELDSPPPADRPLRPGMSVFATVFTQ
jgi:membrane fusion protein (multidrug efflux system)